MRNSIAVLPDFPYPGAPREFLIGDFGGHMVEGSDAVTFHGQDAMRGELVTMRFGHSQTLLS
jgi:hypothetical protein